MKEVKMKGYKFKEEYYQEKNVVFQIAINTVINYEELLTQYVKALEDGYIKRFWDPSKEFKKELKELKLKIDIYNELFTSILGRNHEHINMCDYMEVIEIE